jgi:hypothetical protein
MGALDVPMLPALVTADIAETAALSAIDEGDASSALHLMVRAVTV